MSRFSNEEQIKLFYQNKKLATPRFAYFFMNIFGGVAAIIITFFGFSFEHAFGISNFVDLVVMVTLVVLCAIWFVRDCNKHELINGKNRGIFLVAPFVAVLIVFIIIQSFITKFVILDGGSFEVKTNLIGFLAAFLPLWLATYTVYFCLFGRLVGKYARLRDKKKL